MRPVHPGEILREELDTLGLSASALAQALGVPVNRVTMILNGQRGVTADTALRLARLFRDDAATLAQPAEDLGAAPGGDRAGPRDRRARAAAPERGLVLRFQHLFPTVDLFDDGSG